MISTYLKAFNIGVIAGMRSMMAPALVSRKLSQTRPNPLPNSPDWTISLGAQYTMEFGDWSATMRGDYYHQTDSVTRIWNSVPDRVKGWDNVNLTLTVDNKDLGLEFAGFVKNPQSYASVVDQGYLPT